MLPGKCSIATTINTIIIGKVSEKLILASRLTDVSVGVTRMLVAAPISIRCYVSGLVWPLDRP
jgi:hypothetical protein